MKKYLIMATIGASIANIAHAADAKDEGMTWNGITLYGTIDVGIAHQNHGAPANDYLSSGMEYFITKNNYKAVTALAPNGLSQSVVGLKGAKDFGDVTGIFKLEAGFNPVSGQLSDSLKSMTQNNGAPLSTNSTSWGDSSRAGQLFNSVAFAGLSSKTYGTVTFGRQNGVLMDNIIKYDPQGASYAFSPIGYSGVAGGVGDTEDARLNQVLRYANSFGPVRLDAEYQFESGGTSEGGKAYELGLGTDYKSLSVDLTLAKKYGAVAAVPMANAATVNAAAALGYSSNSTLTGTVSDNTAWALMGKYNAGAANFFAGYEHIDYANPSSPLSSGYNNIGGYTLYLPNNQSFTTDKILKIEWVGLKYAFTEKFDLTGAFYHYAQSAFTGKTATGGNLCTSVQAAGTVQTSPCDSGGLNAFSLVGDYKYNKYFDFYAGVIRYSVSDGLASGYLNDSSVTTMMGARFRF